MLNRYQANHNPNSSSKASTLAVGMVWIGVFLIALYLLSWFMT